MSRYILWDHVSTVITPSGEVFTPQQWEDRYPATQFIDYVMSGGAMNGALMQEYSGMVQMNEEQGCDFSGCVSKQDYLDRIEQFEDQQSKEAEEAAKREAEKEAQELAEAMEMNERMVDALEDLVVLNMPDA